MTKKRFLAMLLTGAMTLSLAACGGTSTGSDAGTDSGADSGSDSYKIALIQQHQTNAFQIAVSEAAEAKADELGVADQLHFVRLLPWASDSGDKRDTLPNA